MSTLILSGNVVVSHNYACMGGAWFGNTCEVHMEDGVKVQDNTALYVAGAFMSWYGRGTTLSNSVEISR